MEWWRGHSTGQLWAGSRRSANGGRGLGAEIPAVGRNNYLKQMLMTENVIPSALLEKKNKIKVIKAYSLYLISSHPTEIPRRGLAPLSCL